MSIKSSLYYTLKESAHFISPRSENVEEEEEEEGEEEEERESYSHFAHGGRISAARFIKEQSP